jgi:hypothetical protein
VIGIQNPLKEISSKKFGDMNKNVASRVFKKEYILGQAVPIIIIMPQIQTRRQLRLLQVFGFSFGELCKIYVRDDRRTI